MTAIAVDKLPEVAQHPLAAPRIALVHTWTNTQNEGWYRIEFDRLGIPYNYISDHVIRNTPNLREKWDVIIWGPVGGSAQAIVRGMPKRSETEAPIPWKKSDLTPNMGQSPDTTDDMRGGMGITGVANLQRFIEAGGLFITIGNNASIPIDFGITEGVSIQEARQLQARGSVFNTTFADRKSPDRLRLRREARGLFQPVAAVSDRRVWRWRFRWRWRRRRRRRRRRPAAGTPVRPRQCERSGCHTRPQAIASSTSRSSERGRNPRGVPRASRRTIGSTRNATASRFAIRH